MADLPSSARVVIIGGGAVGCSSLYHLAKAGWTDCLLIEKNELTSGSSWHAAGNCPTFSGSWSIMKLQGYSNALYKVLGEAVDYPINYHNTGAIRLAHTQDRMAEFRHACTMANRQGIGMEMITPEDMQALYPFLELHDLLGGSYDPTDGHIDPAQLTQAFAAGARKLGAKIQRFCPVTGVSRAGNEWLVETGQGTVRCEYVVNAAGYRAAEVGAYFGRTVPCVSMSHQYLITETIAELAERGDTKLPLLRDPDVSYYLRQERDALLLGPYEWQATPHWVARKDPMPEDFSFQLYPDDLNRLEYYIEEACGRVPILGTVGVKRVVNGPIPYTPDGNPLVGPMPGVPNAFEACVFSFGIVQAGGAGKVLSEWILHGETEWDMWSVDPRRYTGYVTTEYTRAKAVELYRNEYAIGYPNEERPAGRPALTTPIYETLKAKGAVFGARGGWERAAWFPRPGKDPEIHSNRLDHGESFDAVGEECRAIRDTVGIMDFPGFSRFLVQGPEAAAWLEGLIAGRLPRVGRMSLVYVATSKGRILSELTATRLSEDEILLLGAGSGEWHDRDLLARNLPDDGTVTLENRTAAWSALILTGPKSREVLETVTDLDFSNRAFPWLTAQPVTLGTAQGLALRVSYVGELGWELHFPLGQVLSVYQRLWAAGEAHGIRDFGMYAMESLRLEKCYRSWKQDLSTDWSLLEGGLDRFVKLDKTDFPGKAALLAEKQQGTKERFVPLLLAETDTEAPYLSSVWQNGEAVGLVTSCGYGHRIGRSIALATVRSDLTAEGTELEVEIYGNRKKAVVASEPLYDPENARLRV
ncbi:MAG: FAD-dependent oxidoreductase [Rhodospirillales bacterium]|nr:FAD-dependent oxidoreductase [Rhodospirillales bacterium]